MGSVGNNTTTATTRELTDDEMQAEMDAEFQKIDKLIDDFMNQKGKKDKYGNLNFTDLDEMPGASELGIDEVPIEKHTVKDLVKTYIDDYNNNVREYGDGFKYYDDEQYLSVRYKDGKEITVNPDRWDGTQRIPTSNIDSIIVDGGWGLAIAGKNVEVYNLREAMVDGKLGYRTVRQRYEDYNSIRAEFK